MCAIKEYKTRVYDAVLADKLLAHGAVLIRGAKCEYARLPGEAD